MLSIAWFVKNGIVYICLVYLDAVIGYSFRENWFRIIENPREIGGFLHATMSPY
jgi:hypothetical protein